MLRLVVHRTVPGPSPMCYRFFVRAPREQAWQIVWTPWIAPRPIIASLVCGRTVVLQVEAPDDIWRVAHWCLMHGGGHLASLPTEIHHVGRIRSGPLHTWAGIHGRAWGARMSADMPA